MKHIDEYIVTKQYKKSLSIEELTLLKKQLRLSTTVFLLVCIILEGILWATFTTFSLEKILLVIFFGVIVLVGRLFNSTDNNPIKQDINAGVKLVVQGKIEAKREDTSDQDCFLCILNQEFKVSSEQWQQVKVNQPIEIHFSPKSKYVFQLHSLPNL